jgi:hypothetical protein
MKYFALTILSILWMLTTVLLAVSIIGLPVLLFMIEFETGEIYWFSYGRKLLDKLT